MLKRFFDILRKDKNEVDREEKMEKLSKLKARKSMLIGSHMIKIEKKIAQGGYADIYRVIMDEDDNVHMKQSASLMNIVGSARSSRTISRYDVPLEVFALKRMYFQAQVPPRVLTMEQIRAEAGHQLIVQNPPNFEINEMLKRAYEAEVNILQLVGEHENIIKLVDHHINPRKGSAFEVYILLEYCPHGTLFDVIEAKCKMGLAGITNETELLQIIYDVSNGLRHLHNRRIAHRDLKIENVLQGNDGKWKICDFGSCTQRQYNEGLTQRDREAITEEIEKVTTPIYRAPEQIDLFKGYQINQKVDVWALGCIMFTLMYHRPPFLEGEKLAQINGTYRIPNFPPYSEFCTTLLKAMLTVDPAQRASAQQVFDAAQDLSSICLPQLASQDKDGFNFPEMRRDSQLEDFSQQPQLKPAQAPPVDARRGDLSAQHVPSPSNGGAAGATPGAVNAGKRAGEDTSLVDNLLGTVQEEASQEDQSTTTNQSQVQAAPRGFREQAVPESGFQQSREQQWAQRFERMMEILCNAKIDQPEEHAKPLNEKHIRQSIEGIAKDEFLRNRALCLRIVESLNRPKHVLTDGVSALKFLMYAQRLLLFCPQMFEYCVDPQQMLDRQHQNQPILIQDQLLIFQEIHNHWLKVLKKEYVATRTNDQAKLNEQDPFIVRTIVAVSGYLFNKVLMFQEFGNMIDIGLNLRGIVDGAEFQGGGSNGSLNQHINQKKLIQNPLKVMFLKNLMSLWKHIAVLNDKLFQEKQSKTELKVQLGLNILEEQWQLLVNISHLFTAFQLQYNLSKEGLTASLKQSFQEFIQDYQQEFHRNVESMHDFVGVLKSMPQVRHLQKKIPNIPINLAIIIHEIVERNLVKYRSGNFQIKHMLGVNITIGGMKIPIRFKAYIGFASECHEKYDVLLCWRSYRDKLGQKYQADTLRDEMPLAGTIGNPQAASYGQVQQHMPAPQQAYLQPQPYMQSNLQKRFQSISGRHFQETSSLVSKVLEMQNFNAPTAAQQYAMPPSVASSEITIELNEGNLKKRKPSLDMARMDIQDIRDSRRLQTDEERRSMFNSIDLQGIESMAGKTQRAPLNVAQQHSEKTSSRIDYALRASEIDFLQNIDKEGVQQHSNHRNSIGGPGPGAPNEAQGQINSSANPFTTDNLGQTIDPSLLDAFSGPGWQVKGPGQPGKATTAVDGADQSFAPDKSLNLTQVPSDQTFAPFRHPPSPQQNQRASEQEEFFNWGRQETQPDENQIDSSTKPGAAQLQRGAFTTPHSYEEVRVDTLSEAEERQPRGPGQGKGDFVTTESRVYDASQFDSKQSEYFLILNEKNKAIVKKRMMQKQQDYDEDLRQFEEEYQKKQQSIMEREEEAFKKMQEEQKQEQDKVLRKTATLTEAQIEKQNELEKIEVQILQKKALFEKQDKDYADKANSLEKSKKELEDEKLKFQQVKDAEQQKLKQDKQKILEIKDKLDADKERTQKEKQELEQRRAEVEKMEAEIQKKAEDQSHQMQAQMVQAQQIQQQITSNEPDQFTPDINNKEKNLAVQFIDFILRNRPDQKINLTDLTDLTKIGEGAAANVFKAKYKFTDVAVKQLKVHSLIKDGKLSREFQREIEALVHMSHPNLVMFMGATADQGHPVIVTEFCEGGTLFEILHEKKKEIPKITYRQRHRMALEIALGMHFMHSLKQPLMHRDLKSLNILLYKNIKTIFDNGQCKITDFGLARKTGQDGEALTGMAGTFHWMAPEVLENQPYTFKADVYSYGIVLWEILAREPPFADYPPHKIMYNVINYKERPSLEKISRDCPPELVLIMRACWEHDPEKRPDFSDVILALQRMQINC